MLRPIGHHFPADIKDAPDPERIGAADGVTNRDGRFASLRTVGPDVEVAHDQLELDDTPPIRPRSRRRRRHRRGLEAFGPRGEPRR